MSEPDFASRRSPVYGRGGMVAASQPMAISAGIEILSKDGNPELYVLALRSSRLTRLTNTPRAPQISLLDLPGSNQDVCKNKSVALTYSGSTHS